MEDRNKTVIGESEYRPEAQEMNFLIVVDMQNDFITGALANPEAEKIMPAVIERVRQARRNGEHVVWTMDTHDIWYLDTQEGRRLPVEHCIKGTRGWEIADDLRQQQSDTDMIFEKNTFGSRDLADSIVLYAWNAGANPRDISITLVGVCTDICVISNAMLLKASLPESRISIEADCCAGVTPESHETALRAMESCQMDIVRNNLGGIAVPTRPEITD